MDARFEENRKSYYYVRIKLKAFIKFVKSLTFSGGPTPVRVR